VVKTVDFGVWIAHLSEKIPMVCGHIQTLE